MPCREPAAPVDVVHDVDRDGLGSAAMICAELGPEHVRLHPAKLKDVRPRLLDLHGPVIVLDIPAPPSWDGIDVRLDVTWIDHHLAAWHTPPPANVRPILPATPKPTTTMSLLVKHHIVNIPDVVAFVRKLCGDDPEFDWGLAFDTLSRTFPRWSIGTDELPALLAEGPFGRSVPDRLLPHVEEATTARDSVLRILEAAPTRECGTAVVVELSEAEGIPLAQLGHPYVATVRVPTARIDDEVDALLDALAEAAS